MGAAAVLALAVTAGECAGCMRSDPRDARWLIRQVPLGMPIFIRE